MASTLRTPTPGDQHAYWCIHANRRRPHALRETAATGLSSLISDPLTGFVAAFMNFITSAIGVVHYGRHRSNPIHLNRPRSDSDPIIVRSLLTCIVNIQTFKHLHPHSHTHRIPIQTSKSPHPAIYLPT